MIVPMKKVYLAVQAKYRKEAFNKLRELGVIHPEYSNASSGDLEKALQQKASIEAALSLIRPFEPSKKTKNKPETETLDIPGQRENVNLVDLILETEAERKVLEDNSRRLAAERDRIAVWGDFDPKQLKELTAKGIPLFPYLLSSYDLLNIPEKIRYIIVSINKVTARILVIDEELPGIQPFHFSGQPFSQISAELDELAAELFSINKRMRNYADSRPLLEKELREAEERVEFEKALAELVEIEGIPYEYGVSYLTGYAPAENLNRLKETAKEKGWALLFSDPAPSDKPPTLLKNNPLARLVQPLFTFLGTIPGYREFDISPSYLVFFSLFFAMIFADAVYGLLILSLALMFAISFFRRKGKVPDLIKLLMILGFSTVIWGSITGTWFATPQENLPFFLSALILAPFNSNVPMVEFPLFLQHIFRLPEEVPAGEFKTRWSIWFFCFTVAVIQLCWARGKRLMRLLPSLAAIAHVGWFLVMLGLYFLVLYLLLRVPFPPFGLVLIGAGIFVVIVFSEQKGGNFIVNIGKSFTNLFQMFLKTVGCFADIISYIRLFAVGLAGGMISQIVNSMAIPYEGFGAFGLGFILRLTVTMMILVAGHGLNLALNSLSAIVHGVRLNLLEYAGNHLEMEWSGYEYSPFASRAKEQKK